MMDDYLRQLSARMYERRSSGSQDWGCEILDLMTYIEILEQRIQRLEKALEEQTENPPIR